VSIDAPRNMFTHAVCRRLRDSNGSNDGMSCTRGALPSATGYSMDNQRQSVKTQ